MHEHMVKTGVIVGKSGEQILNACAVKAWPLGPEARWRKAQIECRHV
jgi:hypothetical protein